MALIDLNLAFIPDIRGHIGTTVFSKNMYGNYITPRVTPYNPQSTSQQANRDYFKTVTQYWAGGLSQAQRDAFESEASTGNWDFQNSLGNTVRPSGYLLFCLVNLRVKADDFPITSASAPGTLPTVTLDSGAVSPGSPSTSVVLTFSGSTLPASGGMIVKATPSVSPGIYRPTGSLFRNVFDENSGTFTSPLDITGKYTALFPNSVAGDKVFFKQLVYNSAIGNWQLLSSISVVVST